MQTKNSAPPAKVNRFKEMAREVVRHHFGSRPRRIHYKTSGLTNFVFAVSHPEGEFIVRISPEPARLNLFIKEQWAQGRAEEAGVPTAEILEVGMEVVPFPYMISRTIAGTEALYHPERAKIIRDLGHFAAVINSISTSGFGASFDWSSNQLSRCETLAEYLTKEYDYEHRLDILEKYRAVSVEQLKALRKIMLEAMKLKIKPKLNHGDLRLKNVIVDEAGKIKAVLDWEGCSSNIAPQWELSLALHDLWIDEKHEFLKGYGLGERKLIELAPLIKAFNFLNYAQTIEHLAKEKETMRLESYRTRLAGFLDLYSLPGC